MDLSLHRTVYSLIVEGNHKAAERLRKDFRVPDKRSVQEEGRGGMGRAVLDTVLILIHIFFYFDDEKMSKTASVLN